MTAVAVMVAAPFVAALLGLALGRRSPRLAPAVAVLGTGVALAVAGATAWSATRGPVDESARFAVFPTGAVPIGVDLRLDGLAALVSAAVTVVALLVQVYSTGYLRGDPRYSSYAAFVSLFTAAMLLVVVADDLFVLLVGWEVMGACSYFLVGHHWERADARAGAVKAFLTTRTGDVGFLFGIFVLTTALGTANIDEIGLAAGRGELTTGTATAATLLLLCGVVGKSAQFPLHTWLPDAMAGPTPVSALIHAATMVAAGVYLVVRLHEVFLAAPVTLTVLAVLASVTMLGAALAALAQDDLKRVLAWSTVSQLAYMLAALAVGSADAAVFHLLTHAAFKALLFLAAGCVLHAVATNSMTAMGGLRRAMPVTFATTTVGLAALVGLPPLSGGISKEAVIGAAEEAALHGGPLARWAAWLVLVVALATVAVTAAYVVRLWLRTFFGRRRGAAAAHEAPPVMTLPLVLLTVPAALLGLAGLRAAWLPTWLRPAPEVLPPGREDPGDLPVGPALPEAEGLALSTVTTALSVALALLGAAWVLAAWRRDPDGDPAARLGRAGRPARVGFGLDTAYDRLVVRPVRLLALGVRAVDRDVVDAYVRGSGAGVRALGTAVRRSQTGNVQTYLTVLLAGVVLLSVGAVVGS